MLRIGKDDIFIRVPNATKLGPFEMSPDFRFMQISIPITLFESLMYGNMRVEPNWWAKQEYLKLINEDMPANIKRIEFAKSYGDLSENAEYQYAKDEQRALMQKQTLMQADLESVKPGDFSDATTDEVMPGVTVVIATPEGDKTYTVLGEWDNDLEKGIISSKTRLAENMLGKKPGDQFELPGGDGAVVFASVKEIRPLSDEIRDWMKLPPGVQI
jgi:transcription elongation GreA/GreB family factor